MILTTCAACAAPLAHDHKARCIIKGTVVRHHYRERHWESGLCAPYQVQLDEGFQGLVSENDEGLIYASEDNDKSIRAAAPESSDEPVAAPNTSDGDA